MTTALIDRAHAELTAFLGQPVTPFPAPTSSRWIASWHALPHDYQRRLRVDLEASDAGPVIGVTRTADDRPAAPPLIVVENDERARRNDVLYIARGPVDVVARVGLELALAVVREVVSEAAECGEGARRHGA